MCQFSPQAEREPPLLKWKLAGRFEKARKKQRDTDTESSVSMTNEISSTGSVNITREVPGFQYSTLQYSTVFSAKRGNERQERGLQ